MGVSANHFNDDALGSTLDKIYAAGHKKVFSAVGLRAQLKEDITYRVLHGDTAARLMYGDYEQGRGVTDNPGLQQRATARI